MADIKSSEARSKNMSAIKRANTKPELFIRKLLFRAGYRYRLQTTKVTGHPDLWLKKYNTAIFVHGCFWHRHPECPFSYMPKSKEDFWTNKFKKNIQRDQKVHEQLMDQNIKCLVIWECTIRKCQKNQMMQTVCFSKLLHSLILSICTRNYSSICNWPLRRT